MLLWAERGGDQNRACFHGMCQERDEHGVAKVRGNDVCLHGGGPTTMI